MRRDFRDNQEKVMFNSRLRCIMSDGLLSVCKEEHHLCIETLRKKKMEEVKQCH